MKLKELINKYPILRQLDLSKLMYPGNESSNTKLANKLAKNAGQRVTEKDIDSVKSVLPAHLKEIIKDCKKLQADEKD